MFQYIKKISFTVIESLTLEMRNKRIPWMREAAVKGGSSVDVFCQQGLAGSGVFLNCSDCY